MFPFPPLVLLLFSLVSYWTRLIFAPLSTYSSFSYFFFVLFLLSRRGTESWCLITPQMAAGFSVSQRHFCAVQWWWEGRETFQSWTHSQIHPRCLSCGYPGTAGCVFSCLVSLLLRHFLEGFLCEAPLVWALLWLPLPWAGGWWTVICRGPFQPQPLCDALK